MSYTLTEYAYHFLRDKIITGELGVPGTRISDVDMAQMIGISRTPVREAINQLASEGLLDRRPRLGVFIKLPDSREVEELYDLRILLESHAAEKAAEDHGGRILERLREALAEMGRLIEALGTAGAAAPQGELGTRWVAAETAFHMLILEGARNGQILKIASELRLMTQILGRNRAHQTIKDLERIQIEHEKILEAIAVGDARRAGNLMAQHIQRGRQAAGEQVEIKE